MAQDDSAAPASRFVRAAGRIAQITHRENQSYDVDWTPLIDWDWHKPGVQLHPWCPQCGAIVGGKFGARRRTKGQSQHEEWHEALEKWFDQIDKNTELLQRIALLLKPWLDPEPGEDTDGTQDPQDSSPAFYENPDQDDSGPDD